MKVLDLQCAHAHVFEGWFASEDDFTGQLARELIECPVCNDKRIVKMLSAPRLNLGAYAPDASVPPVAPHPAPTSQDVVSAATERALQAAWLTVAKKILTNTEDVGTQFAQEARKIHYGEVPERGIRGQASPEETQALLEEGIAVLPLPLPDALKDPLH